MNQILNLDYTVLLILSSLIIAVLLGWISIRLAPEIGLMDIPGSAGHKTHSNPIPLTGGIVLIDAIIFMVLITGLWKEEEILAIAISGIIIAIFGLMDDFMDLSPMKKLIGQISGSIILIYMGVQIQIFDSPEFFFSN